MFSNTPEESQWTRLDTNYDQFSIFLRFSKALPRRETWVQFSSLLHCSAEWKDTVAGRTGLKCKDFTRIFPRKGRWLPAAWRKVAQPWEGQERLHTQCNLNPGSKVTHLLNWACWMPWNHLQNLALPLLCKGQVDYSRSKNTLPGSTVTGNNYQIQKHRGM